MPIKKSTEIIIRNEEVKLFNTDIWSSGAAKRLDTSIRNMAGKIFKANLGQKEVKIKGETGNLLAKIYAPGELNRRARED